MFYIELKITCAGINIAKIELALNVYRSSIIMGFLYVKHPEFVRLGIEGYKILLEKEKVSLNHRNGNVYYRKLICVYVGNSLPFITKLIQLLSKHYLLQLHGQSLRSAPKIYFRKIETKR